MTRTETVVPPGELGDGEPRSPGGRISSGEGARPPSGRPGLPSPDILWLRTDGPRALALRFWADGPSLYVIATSPSQRWPVQVLRAGGATIGGSETESSGRPSRATRVTDPAEADRAFAGFRRKYGTEVWRRYFATPETLIRLEAGSALATSDSPHERIRAEFDAIARRYTEGVASSGLQRYLKERTTSWLVSRLEGADPLLEIGPGTGIETIPLLGAGHRVVAVDLAETMLSELRSRACGLGVGDRLTTRVGALGDLRSLLEEFGPGSFGGAYSTFGAFNLEPEVAPGAHALGAAVRPGGSLLFTSLNYPGVVPFAWDLLVGRRHEAMARVEPDLRAGRSHYSLDVHLRNPPYWDRLLKPWFDRTDTRPVSLLAPPYDSPRLLGALGPTGRTRARRLDRALSSSRLLAPFAEWSLLTYRRRPEVSANASGRPAPPARPR